MTIIARIDDEEVTAHDFVKLLKFNGKFDDLMEDIMIDKLTVHAARKRGIELRDEEIQEKADQIRRLLRLHRAQDAMEFLKNLGASLEDFERYVTDSLYKQKMRAAVCTKAAVEDYFRLHAPQFDRIEISHIVLDSEAKANEIAACLEDDPDSFEDYAREHTLDQETRPKGGLIGKVARGALSEVIEAKLFNASPGDIVGPFCMEEGLVYEIFKVSAIHKSTLDEATTKDVEKRVYDDWLESAAQEHLLEVV